MDQALRVPADATDFLLFVAVKDSVRTPCNKAVATKQLCKLTSPQFDNGEPVVSFAKDCGPFNSSKQVDLENIAIVAMLTHALLTHSLLTHAFSLIVELVE